MDIIIIIMAAFAIAGLIDDLFGGHLGLAGDFDQGLASMGRLSISIIGFYCIGIAFIQNHAEIIGKLAANLPFDASLITSCILCSDIGGLPIAQRLASSPEIGIYTGALIGSGLGMTMGFQMPVFLSALDKKYLPVLMRGFIYGLVALPAGLFAGGMLLDLPLLEWLRNTIPVLVLCVVLIIAFLTVADLTVKVLTALGSVIRILTYVLFALAIAGVFIPGIAIAGQDLIEEALYMILRTTIVACGGLVVSKLAIQYCHKPLEAVADFLNVNSESVIGLFLCCFQSMAMIPLFPKMNRKGKILNAAFCVCGAYVLGGQMAFVATLLPSNTMPAYMVNKIICGVIAVTLANLFERKSDDQAGSATEVAKHLE